MSKGKILIVEDSLKAAELLAQTLRKHDYEVIIVSRGEEAIEKLKGERPDLMILDIILPDIDGYEVMRRIKNDDAVIPLPVIALTGTMVSGEDVVYGLKEGFNDYIIKPFINQSLLEKIERHLSRKGEDPA